MALVGRGGSSLVLCELFYCFLVIPWIDIHFLVFAWIGDEDITRIQSPESSIDFAFMINFSFSFMDPWVLPEPDVEKKRTGHAVNLTLLHCNLQKSSAGSLQIIIIKNSAIFLPNAFVGLEARRIRISVWSSSPRRKSTLSLGHTPATSVQRTQSTVQIDC